MARDRLTPVFLHLRTVRYLGHAGSDVEISYRTPSVVEAELAADPILATARVLRAGGATVADLLARVDAVRDEVETTVVELAGAQLLRSAPEVMAPLSPRRPAAVAREVTRLTPAGEDGPVAPWPSRSTRHWPSSSRRTGE